MKVTTTMLRDKIALMRDDSNGPFFVGEIGQNHNGDLAIAKRIVIGIDHLVDVVKTVYRDPLDVIPDKPYGGMHSFADRYRAHRDNLDLDLEEILELKDFVERERNVVFGCSFYSVHSLKELVRHKVNFIKFPSRVTADPKVFDECIVFLRDYFKENDRDEYDPLIGASFGMCDEDRSIMAHTQLLYIKENLGARGCGFVASFHTTSAYPTKLDELNLDVLGGDSDFPALFFNGLSCHYPDSFIPDIVAVGRGCSWFERHISLEEGMRGRDHHSSITIKQTAEWCKVVREASIAMGEGGGMKKITPSEFENMKRIGLAT